MFTNSTFMHILLCYSAHILHVRQITILTYLQYTQWCNIGIVRKRTLFMSLQLMNHTIKTSSKQIIICCLTRIRTNRSWDEIIGTEVIFSRVSLSNCITLCETVRKLTFFQHKCSHIHFEHTNLLIIVSCINNIFSLQIRRKVLVHELYPLNLSISKLFVF